MGGINLQFADDPKCENLNLRKLGNGDDVAVDIKLSGIVTKEFAPGAISKLTGCTVDQAQAFWKDTEEREVVYVGLEELSVKTQFKEGQHCYLGEKDVDGKHEFEFKGCNAVKFKFKPIGGGSLKIAFTVQVEKVSEATIGQLSHYINNEVGCELYADPDMFDEDDEGEE